jgi:hypothetical protein
MLTSWRSLTKLAGSGSASGIRIHYSEVWIRGSGYVPKFHGSTTLIESTRAKKRSIKPGKKTVYLWVSDILSEEKKWLLTVSFQKTRDMPSELIARYRSNIQHFLFWIIRSALLVRYRYWLFFRNEVPFRVPYLKKDTIGSEPSSLSYPDSLDPYPHTSF